MEDTVPEVDLGLAGETWPMTSYIQTNIPSMTVLARGIRGSTTKEIAQASAYLVSDFADFITGEVLVMDGGQWLGKGMFGRD